MNDPTYNRKEIDKHLIWKMAFIMSECLNDNAPLGWSKYIYVAEQVVKGTTEYVKDNNKVKRKQLAIH